MRGTIQDRFEAKIDIRNDCWIWTAGKNKAGYGKFWIGGLTQMAHRVAYQLYVGPIPEDLCVCHRCDRPSCVNPDHLFLGTDADNAHDRDNKGRGADLSGVKCGHAKLTEEQVLTIRARFAAGESQHAIGKEYGVDQGNISCIVRRHTWSHLREVAT